MKKTQIKLKYLKKPQIKNQLIYILFIILVFFLCYYYDAYADINSQIFLQTGHSDSVNSICYSPDGKYIASGSSDGTVKLWDVQSGKVIRTFSLRHPVDSVCFSPNGKFIACDGFDLVTLWDAQSGILKRTYLLGHKVRVASVCFSPDGKYIIASSAERFDETVKLWDVQSGKLIRTFPNQDWFENFFELFNDWWSKDWFSIDLLFLISETNPVRFSPDGQKIALGNGKGTLKIWDVNSGKLIKRYRDEDHSALTSLSFSPDSRNIVFANTEGYVKLSDFKSGKIIRTFRHNPYYVFSVSFSIDGLTIASVSCKTIKLWSVGSGNLIKTFQENIKSLNSRKYKKGWFDDPHDLNSGCFSPDGRYISAGSYDIKVWDVQSQDLLKVFLGKDNNNNIVLSSLSPDGKKLATVSNEETFFEKKKVYIWDTQSEQVIKTFWGEHNIEWPISAGDRRSRYFDGDATTKLKYNNYDQYITLALLPNNEWISFRSNSLYYNSSLNGDKYAAVRFNNNSYNWEPLTKYRKKYKKNLIELTNTKKNQSNTKTTSAYMPQIKTPKIEKKIPIVSIISPINEFSTKKKSISIEVKINNYSNSIKNIDIIINGNKVVKKIGASSIIDKNYKDTLLKKYFIDLVEGKNIIQVVVTNDYNLTSNDKIIIFRKIKKTKGDLFFLSVGVDHLKNIPNNDLEYAAKDAKDIDYLIKQLEGKLYNKVYSYRYTDHSEKKPYSYNIMHALRFHLQQAKPKDTVIIYFAGHGITKNNKYIFITRDARLNENGKYYKNTILKWTNVSSELNKLKCMKLIILDTCYTGGVDILSLLKQENSKYSQIDQNQSNKIIVFTSTSKNQVAEECGEFKNSCFTYAIKKGLGAFLKNSNKNMPADYDKDDNITIEELKVFVTAELKEITQSNQTPDIFMPQGGNFIFYRR